jgi:hypothetical protein
MSLGFTNTHSLGFYTISIFITFLLHTLLHINSKHLSIDVFVTIHV